MKHSIYFNEKKKKFIEKRYTVSVSIDLYELYDDSEKFHFKKFQ